MDFAFDSEEEAFRASVRQLARGELSPGYGQRASSTEFPWTELKTLGHAGLLGLGLPEVHGGQGPASHVVSGICCEEVAYADFNLAFLPFYSALVGKMLAKFGTEEVQRDFLAPLVAGDALVSFALTEPDAGSDAARLRTRIVPVDGGYRVDGEKTSVTILPHAQACIVFGSSSPEWGNRRISAVVVPLSAAGVTTSRFNDMGMLPLGRGALHLDGVVVPASHLLGREGGAFRMVMGEFDFSRALLGLMLVAAAQASVDEAIEHAKERRTFGQPLLKWEAISFRLAEHLTLLEAARWLCYRALSLRDSGKPHTKEAAMCKWWIPDLAGDAVRSAMLIHGHGSYSTLYPLQQRLRDMMGLHLGDGAPEVQKVVIVREVMGREYVPYAAAD
ncbi:MAG: acyl-CoA dehydrogenase family protein [Actinomycetota bacterium]